MCTLAIENTVPVQVSRRKHNRARVRFEALPAKFIDAFVCWCTDVLFLLGLLHLDEHKWRLDKLQLFLT